MPPTFQEVLELLKTQEAQLARLKAQVEELAKLHEEDARHRSANEKV